MAACLKKSDGSNLYILDLFGSTYVVYFALNNFKKYKLFVKNIKLGIPAGFPLGIQLDPGGFSWINMDFSRFFS